MHPLVTLLEKLDALMRRLPREDAAPATFERHFEDAARIVRSKNALPLFSDYASVRALADEMLAQQQIAALPSSTHAAFAPKDDDRWSHSAEGARRDRPDVLGPASLARNACADVRSWLSHTEVGP